MQRFFSKKNLQVSSNFSLQFYGKSLQLPVYGQPLPIPAQNSCSFRSSGVWQGRPSSTGYILPTRSFTPYKILEMQDNFIQNGPTKDPWQQSRVAYVKKTWGKKTPSEAAASKNIGFLVSRMTASGNCLEAGCHLTSSRCPSNCVHPHFGTGSWVGCANKNAQLPF